MKIPILHSGRLIVNDEFLVNTDPAAPASSIIDCEYIGDGDNIQLDNFTEKLNRLYVAHSETKPQIDGTVAEFIHRELRLTKREAANHKFWHYLTVVKCPKYVAWRHADTNGIVSRERYLGRWDGNALGRLWWWADFTVDPSNTENPYHRTIKCASSQEFMLHTVDNLLGGNRYLINALCDTVFSGSKRLPDADIRRLFVRVNAVLVTVVIDALNKNEVDALIRNIYSSLKK